MLLWRKEPDLRMFPISHMHVTPRVAMPWPERFNTRAVIGGNYIVTPVIDATSTDSTHGNSFTEHSEVY